jgi:hypothetical protein
MSIPDSNLPDSISTPEGDAEDAPDTPLTSEAEDLLVPPGSAPNPHDPDQPSDQPTDKHKPTGIEAFIDEIVRGEYM